MDELIRVVVADDEPITRMDISGMLTELGYSVVGEAGDGFDAVELCRKLHPDIVLMDVKMPIFDGLSAAKIVSTEGLASCVVLLTAYSDRETIEGAKAAGAAGYLVKPVDSARIVPTLEIALEQSLRLDRSEAELTDARNRLNAFKLIEQAKGILAAKEGISETEAYARLRKAAMDKRVQLVVLAEKLVESSKQ